MDLSDSGMIQSMMTIYQCVFHRIDMFIQMYYGVVIGFLPVIAAIIGFIEKRDSKESGARSMNPLYFFVPFLFAGIVGTLTGLTIYANQDGAYLKFVEDVLGHAAKVNPFAYESLYGDFFLKGKTVFPYSKWAGLVFFLYFVPMFAVLVYIFYRYWEQPKAQKSIAKDMVLLGGIGLFIFSILCFPVANYDVRKQGAEFNKVRVKEFFAQHRESFRTEEVKPAEKTGKAGSVPAESSDLESMCFASLPIRCSANAIRIFGFIGLFFGLFTAAWPKASIRVYQWIMKMFNWSVNPIDERREVRNTRVLGSVLAVLGLAICLMVSFS